VGDKCSALLSVERLCQVVSAHWQHPASEILAVVKADIATHMNGTPLIDDITLIILKERYS